MKRIKEFIKNNKLLLKCVTKLHNIISFNHFKGKKNNNFVIGTAFLKKTKIHVIGKNNKIIIDDYSKLNKCVFKIRGNNNIVHISNNVIINETDFHILDNNNEISLGHHTTITRRTNLSALESTKLIIGSDCMLATDIMFRTGDFHKIVDSEGKRINPSKDIILGDHVWICAKVTGLKGTKIASNCIVGACSLVTKDYSEENCIIAGQPASVVKRNINWMRERT